MLASSSRLQALTALLSSSTLLWVLSLLKRDASLVDSFWSLGFLLQTYIYRKQESKEKSFDGRKNLILSLVAIWAIKLSAYITWRNSGVGEDYRYTLMRKSWGNKFWIISLFQTFYLQSVLNWIIGQPLLDAQSSKKKFNGFDVLGTILWVIGFLFETIGDYQLARFKSNPANKGRLMTSGLWSLTRHPNYFGNASMFWGFYCFSLAAGKWKTIFGPILMNYLLVKVSGVAMLERGLAKTKPGFEAYVKSTPSFVPRLW
eukprot:TRINITY_DN2894_c0_g1_i10.p1 TRINITY_DN2894_c0_g1~~TRINITY_DN2894_c0_g1_i10.p1  ORF type:complete len:259 (-),score=37.34 TRINITY_DN2894_c0_g1_i10:109-885(-)